MLLTYSHHCHKSQMFPLFVFIYRKQRYRQMFLLELSNHLIYLTTSKSILLGPYFFKDTINKWICFSVQNQLLNFSLNYTFTIKYPTLNFLIYEKLYIVLLMFSFGVYLSNSTPSPQSLVVYLYWKCEIKTLTRVNTTVKY